MFIERHIFVMINTHDILGHTKTSNVILPPVVHLKILLCGIFIFILHVSSFLYFFVEINDICKGSILTICFYACCADDVFIVSMEIRSDVFQVFARRAKSIRIT